MAPYIKARSQAACLQLCPLIICESRLRGFSYCDLLLTIGQYDDVRVRASRALEIAEVDKRPLDAVLDHLSLGRAEAMAVEKGAGCPKIAQDHFDSAIELGRSVGQHGHLPRVRLARAAFLRQQGEYESAHVDWAVARCVSERGHPLGP